MAELLRIEKINKYISQKKGFFKHNPPLRVVKNISLSIHKNQNVSIIGQSGAGKTTLAKIMAGIISPSSGKRFYRGKDVSERTPKALRTKIQMIFQDPYSTLNPMMSVRDILIEPLLINHVGTESTRNSKITDLIVKVGLSQSILDKYPHQLSGGMRQRIAIARALSVEPELLICDEPFSSVDILRRGELIQLFRDLEKNGTTFLFITHDLNLVKELSHDVAIMFGGEVIEFGTVEKIYNNPQHEYTKDLLGLS